MTFLSALPAGCWAIRTRFWARERSWELNSCLPVWSHWGGADAIFVGPPAGEWAFAPDSRQTIGTCGKTSPGAAWVSLMGAFGLPGQGELNLEAVLNFQRLMLALVTIRYPCMGSFMDSRILLRLPLLPYKQCTKP